MKVFALIGIFFAVVFVFEAHDDFVGYSKKLEIEKAPAYTVAKFEEVEKIKRRKTNEVVQFMNYTFNIADHVHRGATVPLNDMQIATYVETGSLEVAYFEGDPDLNIERKYFREGQSTAEFRRSLVVTGFWALVKSLPLSILFSWNFGWVNRKKFRLTRGPNSGV